MTRLQLIEKVIVLLNEKDLTNSPLVSQDTVTVTATIETCISPAIQLCMDRAPQTFAVSLDAYTTVLGAEGSSTTVKLPADFAALIEVRLNNWERSVTKLLNITAPEYKLESNRWVGSKIYTPHAYLTSRKGEKVMLLFPSGSYLNILAYLPKLDGSPESIAKLPDKLSEAIAYMCASLVCQIYENIEAHNTFMNLAVQLLNIVPNERTV